MHVIYLLVLFLGQPTTEEKPCKWEYDNAVSVCRALGRKSRECKAATEKFRLCRALQPTNDPLEGIE